jgi:uncharacterized membrane protein
MVLPAGSFEIVFIHERNQFGVVLLVQGIQVIREKLLRFCGDIGMSGQVEKENKNQ